MWEVSGKTIAMTEGDWGVQLPITIPDPTFTAADELRLAIKNGATELVTKTYTYQDISENTVNLELTEAESEALPVGTYLWTLDWYQDNAFLYCLVPAAIFKVVDKA